MPLKACKKPNLTNTKTRDNLGGYPPLLCLSKKLIAKLAEESLLNATIGIGFVSADAF